MAAAPMASLASNSATWVTSAVGTAEQITAKTVMAHPNRR